VEVTERALQTVAASGADALVSVGGGSTIGLGKALASRTRLPQIVVPTTYAGSEVTPILGETVGCRKTTIRDPNLLPKVVLYDVDLTLTLPGPLSMTSGINAMAHAAEALYAINGNPVVSTLAEMGIASLARALPRIREKSADPVARSDALFGAWTCGWSLSGKLRHGAPSQALPHPGRGVRSSAFGDAYGASSIYARLQLGIGSDRDRADFTCPGYRKCRSRLVRPGGSIGLSARPEGHWHAA
jgi:alcohol dehydrogenase YqhD (iron-dependent ADH family)